MRSASHGHITPAASAAEPTSSSPTETNPQRRVMRAAWALHRDRGGPFADALRIAWRREKARAALRAAHHLRGEIVDTANICEESIQMSASMPIDEYRFFSKNSRSIIIDTIDRLVNVLDFIDGDLDSEHDVPDDDGEGEYDDREMPKLLAPIDKSEFFS